MPYLPLRILFTLVLLVFDCLAIRTELRKKLPAYVPSTGRIRGWRILFDQIVFFWAGFLTWALEWTGERMPYFIPWSAGVFFVLCMVSSRLLKRWMRCASCKARVPMVSQVHLEGENHPKTPSGWEVQPEHLERCPICGAENPGI